MHDCQRGFPRGEGGGGTWGGSEMIQAHDIVGWQDEQYHFPRGARCNPTQLK